MQPSENSDYNSQARRIARKHQISLGMLHRVEELVADPPKYSPAALRKMFQEVIAPQRKDYLERLTLTDGPLMLRFLAKFGEAVPRGECLAAAIASSWNFNDAIRQFEHREGHPFREIVLYHAYGKLLETADDSKMMGLSVFGKAGLTVVLTTELNGPTLKNLIGTAVKMQLANETPFSAFLMRRAIDGNHQPVTEADLTKNFPGYMQELKELIKTVTSNEWVDGGIPLGTSKVVELPFHNYRLRPNKRNGNGQAWQDFGQALGSVTIKHNKDGSYTLMDYFDFEKIVDEYGTVPDTPRDLLMKALAMRDSGYDIRNRIIGRIFAQEGDNEKPTATSVPIRIHIPAPDHKPRTR